MLRALPYIVTILVGLAHALAWRTQSVFAFVWIGAFYAPALLLSIAALRRDEVLGSLLRPVPGDAARGIGVGTGGLVALFLVALAALRFFPGIVARDLQGILRVAISAPTAARGAAILCFAVIEEVVWRGAVCHALEERFGSKRAPWIASALFVVAIVPSLHASLIAAGIVIGALTAWLRARFGRLSIPIVVHAVVTWITVEMMLPTLWDKIRQLG